MIRYTTFLNRSLEPLLIPRPDQKILGQTGYKNRFFDPVTNAFYFKVKERDCKKTADTRALGIISGIAEDETCEIYIEAIGKIAMNYTPAMIDDKGEIIAFDCSIFIHEFVLLLLESELHELCHLELLSGKTYIEEEEHIILEFSQRVATWIRQNTNIGAKM